MRSKCSLSLSVSLSLSRLHSTSLYLFFGELCRFVVLFSTCLSDNCWSPPQRVPLFLSVSHTNAHKHIKCSSVCCGCGCASQAEKYIKDVSGRCVLCSFRPAFVFMPIYLPRLYFPLPLLSASLSLYCLYPLRYPCLQSLLRLLLLFKLQLMQTLAYTH